MPRTLGSSSLSRKALKILSNGCLTKMKVFPFVVKLGYISQLSRYPNSFLAITFAWPPSCLTDSLSYLPPWAALQQIIFKCVNCEGLFALLHWKIVWARICKNIVSDYLDFHVQHGGSTSTASQLTSPASQKSKDLNKVPLLFQDLGTIEWVCLF